MLGMVIVAVPKKIWVWLSSPLNNSEFKKNNLEKIELLGFFYLIKIRGVVFGKLPAINGFDDSLPDSRLL